MYMYVKSILTPKQATVGLPFALHISYLRSLFIRRIRFVCLVSLSFYTIGRIKMIIC